MKDNKSESIERDAAIESRLNSWTSNVLSLLMDRFSQEDCPIPGMRLSGISLAQVKDATTVNFCFNRIEEQN